jgi:hypothetical protein
MKTTVKRLAALNSRSARRAFVFILFVLLIFMGSLYLLITSPA